MFLGEYSHSCDSKNRLRVPPKFKKEINGQLVICKGNDGCLFVFSKTNFDETFAKMNELPMFDSKIQRPLRLIFSSAQEIEEDGQGRFLLPSNLKEFANIKKDVVFVGVGNRIELWAKELWDKYCKLEDKNFDDLLQELGDYGI